MWPNTPSSVAAEVLPKNVRQPRTHRLPIDDRKTEDPRRQLRRLVYARHGRELMGCKSPVRESC